MAGILGSGIQDALLLHPIHHQWAKDLYDQAVATLGFQTKFSWRKT